MRRMRHGRTARFGSAMALLALLALTLLAPIHLVHAIERDALATAVHADCEEAGGHAQHGKHKPLYCPVCALAKAAASLVVPTTPLPIRLAVVTRAHFSFHAVGVAARPQNLLPHARAPPVSV